MKKKHDNFDISLVPLFGKALFGTHWQADLSRDLGISKSLLSRSLRGEREPPPHIAEKLKAVVLNRARDMLYMLDNEGMPLAGSEDMRAALWRIKEGIDLLKEEEETKNL